MPQWCSTAMAVLLDLRPDRALLDPKFESYRLSLDSFPILKKTFPYGVEDRQLKDEQFGFLHAHLASMFNHLFYDPWAQQCVFFVNESRHIQWSHLSPDGRLSDLRVVWQLPSEPGMSYKANTSISFAGQEWAVVSDGDKTFYILNTPSRPEGEPWQMCFCTKLDYASSPCVLLNSLHQQFPSSQQVDSILAYVTRLNDLPESSCIENQKKKISQTEDAFVCVLEWITFTCLQGSEANGWHVKQTRRLVGCAVPVYLCLEPGSSSVCLLAEREFTFVFDSQKQSDSIDGVENNDTLTEAVSRSPLYTYVQSLEDISVLFKAPDNLSKSSVSVHMEPHALHVKVDGKSIVGGQLAGTIDVSSSSWTLEQNKLELTLCKSKTGEMWRELVVGDTRGQEIHDTALLEEIHNRLAHLTSETEAGEDGKSAYNPQELEDCDFSVDILTFQRLDGNSHRVTHQSNLGGHQWLFSQTANTENLPVFCLRHDVDGIVWQPENVASEGELQDFRVVHSATYPALGYVLASKQDRKFIVSSPDFAYVAVCDGSRHVYVYRQPESLNSALELRNRKTGQGVSKIAKQHVINLEDSDTILGLHSCRDCIFVLSKKALFGIKV